MADRSLLEELAQFHGVQTSFHDGLGQHRVCSDESLVAILRSIGALDEPERAADALQRARLEHWRTVLEPVAVAWVEDGAPAIRLRLARDRGHGTFRLSVTFGDGDGVDRQGRLQDLPVTQAHEEAGEHFVELALSLEQSLPLGRHRMTLDVGGESWEGWIFSAPRRAHADESARHWGLFAPLYALWSGRSTGGGDLTDLESLVDLVREMGGDVVGTLPLCATFLGEVPHDPSPYAPVSRLFWNELYLDPARVPEFEHCPAARERLASAAWHREAEALRALPMVDYRRQMALRRSVLEELCDHFFEGNDGTDLSRFVEEKPAVLDYARFRATTETRAEVWHCWPERLREGLLEPGDWDERSFRYHLWAQWRTTEQLKAVCDRAREHGPGIYLDMPLGVHPDGYDAWRERNAFLWGCAAGAPPDVLFTAGQNWGFAPPSPRGMRADGYRYLTECLRHQMRLGGVLRIDHVMGLHRIYCVPPGGDPTDGVYVRYRAEELYAVLTLESARHRTMVVGEDLGTVPDEVREAMDRHGLHRMYVFPFALRPGQDPVIQQPRENVVASLDTHDMPTFEAYASGRDIDDRLALGLLDEPAADARRRERHRTVEALAHTFDVPCEPRALLKASVEYLASSPARLLLINLEDLWLEPDPQNVPGTSHERPNWRRRARHCLEEVRRMEPVLSLLREVAARRRR